MKDKNTHHRHRQAIDLVAYLHTMNILIVEDLALMRKQLDDLLVSRGYTNIYTASSAKEAYEVLGIDGAPNRAVDIDLILLDIIMPEIDGLQLLQRIKGLEPLKDIPVIMVTALADDRNLQLAFDAGAVDYITKPFNDSEVCVRVNSALRLKKEMDGRKARETELRETMNDLRSFKTAVENMQLGLTFADIEGRIVYTNPADCRMHGYTMEGMIGMPASMLAPENYRKAFEPLDLIRMRNFIRESVNVRKDGSAFPVQLMSSVVVDDKEAPVSIVTTCEDITERKRAEAELIQYRDHLEELVAERTLELSKADKELKHLSARIMTAHEEERKRLSRELHDGIAQSLLAIKLAMQVMKSKMSEGCMTDGMDSIEEIICNVTDCIAEVRLMARDLRPSFLEHLEIDEVVTQHCRKFSEDTEMKTVVDVEKIGYLSPDKKDNIYRICREAMNNALKHSGCGELLVTLRKDGDSLFLTVRDNGAGFDVGKAFNSGNGLGLSSMKERIELLGGDFRVESSPGIGTSIYVEVPLR